MIKATIVRIAAIVALVISEYKQKNQCPFFTLFFCNIKSILIYEVNEISNLDLSK